MNDEQQMPPPHAGRPSSDGSPLAFGLVIVALLALNFGMVTLTGQIADAEGGPTVKPVHLIFALLGAFVVMRGRAIRPRREVVLYFAVTILSGFVASLAFAPQRALANVLITFCVALIGGSLGGLIGERRALRALRIVSLVLLLAVIAKDILYANTFIAFLVNPNGHPDIPTFYTGGPNLEATWVSMAGFFFIGTPLCVPYVLASLGLGAVYASRVGVLIAGMVLATSLARSWTSREREIRPRPRTRYLLTAVVVAVAMAATGTLALRFSEALDYVGQRFQNIGDEPGSLGRLTLWVGGVRVFAEHPLGVGQGNSVPELKRIMGVDVPEDNLHNLYLQHLVETGIPGLFALLVFVVMVWRRLAASRFQDRILLYVVCYLVFATIQFSGADFLVWFTYGLHTGVAARGGGSGPI